MAGLFSIGAGPFQGPLIEAAKRRGLQVVACDNDPHAPGLALADQAHIADIRDPEACLAIARACKVDAVSCLATEAGVVAAAHVAQALGLPGLPVSAAEKVTDKLTMRQAIEAAGMACPAYFGCHSLDEARAAFSQIGGPVVVKPANGAGSRGVSYVAEIEALAAAYALAADVAKDRAVLVEAFMPGHEVAVEGFMWGDRFELLCISDKTRTQPPYLLDLRIVYPSERPAAELRAIAALAEASARALGVRDAPLHIEIMMTAEGPRLVEVAARGAGFHVFSKIVPWVTGIATVEAQIDLAYGRRPPARSGAPLRAAILDFPEIAPGTVRSVKGVDEVRVNDDVMFLEVFKSPGDEIGPLRSGADRALAIATRGRTLKHAHAALDWARDRLRIETQGS